MSWQSRIEQSNATLYCSHANCEIELNSTVVYPAEILPHQSPRITNRTCSHFLNCNLQDKTACSLDLRTPRFAVPVEPM